MLRKTRGGARGINLTQLASMRPQRNAAENVDFGTWVMYQSCASMRPQRNAAENGRWLHHAHPNLSASMRPQRNAAENEPGLARRQAFPHCFNEAAA